ncbi:hypothetical protein CGCA056_v013738 [Colletotrichum aenigma]|uniref:uncharacterized protein n=1 Tax=Colletotrichum aenigma TaxID=1215731 RepID=UPI001872676A|nr:uncharacterized protein CGCA056_v013738 [Colletotrichum aenigma]KAF5507251.1 hypothetical protein CGCA056_v013738 [Colletotrichum aenigma]
MGSYCVCKSAPVRKLEAELSSLAHRPACARSRSSIEEISELLDFVLYDTPKDNPFRDLIAMAYQQAILLQAIIASSALHMSNAYQTVIKFFKHLNNEGLDSEQHKLSGLPID